MCVRRQRQMCIGESINTVADLVSKTEEDMMKVRNLGRKSLEEVKKKLEEYDLTLKKEEE